MNQEKLTYWLTLSSLPNIGWSRAHKLIDLFGSIEKLFQASFAELTDRNIHRDIARRICQADAQNFKSSLNWLQESSQHHILTPDDNNYPRLLLQSQRPPLILYCRGQLEWLHHPQLAIVGSRTPTPAGQQLAKDFTTELANAGLIITSGLALGIDGIAHRNALSAGAPTVAVAATGLDRVYPARHLTLAKDITHSGIIVSELPPGTGVRGTNFPTRNRIIAGLSLGVLVVEAAVKSGSLITAAYAIDNGREVFAIPGSVHNSLTKGCHSLIKQGAYLVETAQDILSQLGWLASGQQALNNQANINEHPSLDSLDDESQMLLKQLDYTTTPIDIIVERCEKSVAEVSAKLLTLELDGWICAVPGGYQRQK